ncbi:MAG TPA: ferritin-like domain-containing protein [Polyangiaceae bacterium]|nr:ferritin-like domain-containing protein [Polyangiaceae bacterium]
MATAVGIESNVVTLLRHLVELDYDAIEAYEAAIERLEGEGDRATMGAFLEDHRRHVRELTALLEGAGHEAPSGPDIKRVLTKGKVVLGGLVGDHAVLVAMKTNEEDTNTAYERAAGRADLSPDVRDLLARNLSDERRHRDWIVARIAAMAHAVE